jgi:hypothetical protein
VFPQVNAARRGASSLPQARFLPALSVGAFPERVLFFEGETRYHHAQLAFFCARRTVLFGAVEGHTADQLRIPCWEVVARR